MLLPCTTDMYKNKLNRTVENSSLYCYSNSLITIYVLNITPSGTSSFSYSLSCPERFHAFSCTLKFHVLYLKKKIKIKWYENTVLVCIYTPSNRSSTAIRTPLSNARASAAVWKVSPNFLSPVFQWWKVGMTLLYSKSFFIVQLNTTCRQIKKRCN